ncbi:hypothetical protein, partial [Streptococcus pneumoniae]|uniref:hypothetical protein n=1 Tax=Streptococcus pneumoniae TaxID=1313 RepID=UPI001C2CA5E1
IPREVLVPELPETAEQVEALLTGLRGSRVSLRVPQRGDKRALMGTVQENAELLEQVYGALEDTSGIPREVLVPELPETAEQVEALLTGLRGSRVSLRVPQRGDKRAL